MAAGATEMAFKQRAAELFESPEFEDGDEDIVSLACRRITFEWVLRRHVLDTGRVDFRDGVAVTRLEARRDGDVPHVTGVWARRGNEPEALVDADLVVDASGRRSKLGEWLPAIGTPAIREASDPCGIFYTSRFYQLLEGVEAPALDGGVVGADLGYLKVGIFSGDSRVVSITLAASPTDTGMRRILRGPGFEEAVAAVPLAAEWAAISTPISEAHGMANLNNTRRWLVEDGEPLVTGFVALGDSLIHTNPIVGRGCSLAWTEAFELAACVDAHGDDPRALILAYDAHIERDIVPWYDLQIAQDADAIAVAQAQERGEDPYQEKRADGTNDPRAFMRGLIKDGLLPALREDLVLFRLFLRTMNLLDPPAHLMQNPIVMQRLLASYARRGEREPVVFGPQRQEMVERLAAVA